MADNCTVTKQRKLATETSIAEIEAIEQVIADDYIRIKQRMRQIPQRIAPVVVGETDEDAIKNEISNEIDDALTEVANEFYIGEFTARTCFLVFHLTISSA